MKADTKHAGNGIGAKGSSARTAIDSNQSNARKGGYRFKVHDDAIALCRLVRTLAALIERHDRKMAAQLRTATSSIVLNTAERAGAEDISASGSRPRCGPVAR